MNEIDLTFKERAHFVWMFEILKKLDPDHAKDYDWRIHALSNGYQLEYGSALGSLMIYDEETPLSVCKETRDILHMYRVIQNSYGGLSDKSDIDKEKIHFKGFDGHEEDHLGYATYLLEQRNQFKESQNEAHDYDSHEAVIDDYRNMLKVFSEITKGERFHFLDKDQLIQLLKVAP
nr:YfbU family protein [uncultured Carboxylicivirga sp.]